MTQDMRATADRRRRRPEPKAGRLNARVVFHAVRRHPLAFVGVLFCAGGRRPPASGSSCRCRRRPRRSCSTSRPSRRPSSPRRPRAGSTSRRTGSPRRPWSRAGGPEQRPQASPRSANSRSSASDPDDDWRGWREALTVDTKAGPEYMRVTLEGDDGDGTADPARGGREGVPGGGRRPGERARGPGSTNSRRTSERAKAEVKTFHAKIDEIALRPRGEGRAQPRDPRLERQDDFRRPCRHSPPARTTSRPSA